MSLRCAGSLMRNHLMPTAGAYAPLASFLHTTAVCNKASAGRFRKPTGLATLLTYEMAHPPDGISKSKAWNSWNTTTLKGGRRSQLTAIEDMFIRNFMNGTWPGMILGQQVIIKRQHNIVRIAAVVHVRLPASKCYFLIGFSEEMLSIWLQCPVKLEIQMAVKEKGYVRVLQ